MWPLCLVRGQGAARMSVKLSGVEPMVPGESIGIILESALSEDDKGLLAEHPTFSPTSVCFMVDDQLLAELPVNHASGSISGAVPPCYSAASSASSLSVVTAFAVANGAGPIGGNTGAGLGAGCSTTGFGKLDSYSHDRLAALLRSASRDGGYGGGLARSRGCSRSNTAQALDTAHTGVSGMPGPAVSLLSVPDEVSKELHALFAKTVGQLIDLEEDPSLSHMYIRDTVSMSGALLGCVFLVCAWGGTRIANTHWGRVDAYK